MEKLKGGNVLLDLTNITLSVGSETSIADNDILKGFLELYPLVKSGSPKNLIFLKVTNGSEEIIVPCEHIIASGTLKIRGTLQFSASNYYGLVIEITYSVGSYDAISITSAKYTYSKDLTIAGDLGVIGDLDVDGGATIADDVTLAGDLSVAGAGTITGDLSVAGAGTIIGDLSVGGSIGSLDNIVDSDGNSRFQSFDIDFDTDTFGDAFNGLCYLNGHSLNIVGTIKRTSLTSNINPNDIIGTITIPTWLYNKIYTWQPNSLFIRNFNVTSGNTDIDVKLGLNKTATIGVMSMNLQSLSDTITIMTLSTGNSVSFEVNLIIE